MNKSIYQYFKSHKKKNPLQIILNIQRVLDMQGHQISLLQGM